MKLSFVNLKGGADEVWIDGVVENGKSFAAEVSGQYEECFRSPIWPSMVVEGRHLRVHSRGDLIGWLRRAPGCQSPATN